LGNLEKIGQITDLWLVLLFGLPTENISPIIGSQISWINLVLLSVIRPIAYFLFFALPVLVISLGADAWLKRRVLEWYSLGHRVKIVFLAITAILLSFQILVVIPVSNRLFFPDVYPNWSFAVLLGIVFGVGIMIVSGVLFAIANHCLSRRCPICHQQMDGRFELGKRHCNQDLHQWLIAHY